MKDREGTRHRIEEDKEKERGKQPQKERKHNLFSLYFLFFLSPLA